MFMGFLGFLVCIGLIDLFKELSKLSHNFSQLSNILLCFLNGSMQWLVRLGGCEIGEFMPKLKAEVLQSSNNLVGYLPKDWNMYAILMFAVAFLIITDRGWSLVVLFT
jgi:hypothetical protein